MIYTINRNFKYILISIGILSCSVKNRPSVGKLNVINFTLTLPIPAENFMYAQIQDTIKIIYYKDYIVYGVPVNHSASTMTAEGQRFDTAYTWYRYFVTRSGIKNGILFDTLAKTATVMNVDSFISRRGVYRFPEMFDSSRSNEILVEKVWLSESRLVLKYISKSKPDDTYSDSTLVFLEKQFPPVNYSLSPELEKEFKMKVTRVQWLYAGNPNALDEYAKKKREIAFGIMPGNENENYVYDLIRKFDEKN